MRSKNSKSLLYMFLASLLFFVMALLVKTLDRIPTIEVVFFRAWTALFFCAVILYRNKLSFLGNNRKLLLLRGVFGTGGLIGFFYTVQNIPIATAVTVSYLAPLFTTVLSALFLSDRVRPLQWVCLLTSLYGVVLINGFEYNLNSTMWILLGLLGAFSAACAYICVNLLKETEHPITVIFYFPIVTLPIVLPSTISQWVWPNVNEWILLLLLGTVVQAAQYFMTLSYQLGRPSVVSIVNYFGVIYAALAGMLIFDERLSLNAQIGLFVIFASVVISSLVSMRSSR